MLKLNRAAGNQYISTPDTAVLTYPNSDWTQLIAYRVAGDVSGIDPQYISSNNVIGTAGINLAHLSAQDADTAAQNKLGVFVGAGAVADIKGTTTLTNGLTLGIILVRSNGVIYMKTCPILSNMPTDGSSVVIEGSYAVSTAFNGTGGFYIGSRSDQAANRLSDQAFGRFARVDQALSDLEIAKWCYGMKISDLGYTPVFEVDPKDISTVVDTGPNALPFTVSGTPTVVADPVYGYSGSGTPPVTNPDTPTIDMVEIVANRTIQRGFPVQLSISYTGEKPASVEYQLYAEDGVTITSAWTAIPGGVDAPAPVLPAGGPRRIQIRSKNASGTVLAQSAVKTNSFRVGGVGLVIGSSSAQKLFESAGGTGFTVNPNTSKSSNGSAWSAMSSTGSATLLADLIQQQANIPIGLLDCGVSGTTLAQWLGNGTSWANAASAVTASGNKLEFVYITVGSNDAEQMLLTSSASHLANMQALVDRVRTMTGQPNLPVIWSGSNRRPALNSVQADRLRMGENGIGDYPNVSHVQTIDFDLASDNVHLASTSNGYPASVRRSAYVLGRRLYGDGVYARGPLIGSGAFTGDTVSLPVSLRNGAANGIVPTTDFTGFSLSDASGTPGVVSRSVVSGKPTIKYDRNLVAPVSMSFLSGSSPDVSGLLYDNGSTPLPATVNTSVPLTESSVVTPPADTTAPTMQGQLTVSNVTDVSALVSWQNALDNVGVVSYEVSINGGTSYMDVSSARQYQMSGLTASTTYQVRVRAVDAAGNRSVPLSLAVTTNAATVTPPAGANFTRSISRTITVKTAPRSFTGGSYWSLSNPKRPGGVIDPQSTIDITFNWTDVLADISDEIAAVQFDLVGLTNKGSYRDGAFATIFVSNPTNNPSITCRITTASTPPRVEDATVYFNVEQQ